MTTTAAKSSTRKGSSRSSLLTKGDSGQTERKNSTISAHTAWMMRKQSMPELITEGRGRPKISVNSENVTDLLNYYQKPLDRRQSLSSDPPAKWSIAARTSEGYWRNTVRNTIEIVLLMTRKVIRQNRLPVYRQCSIFAYARVVVQHVLCYNYVIINDAVFALNRTLCDRLYDFLLKFTPVLLMHVL